MKMLRKEKTFITMVKRSKHAIEFTYFNTNKLQL